MLIEEGKNCALSISSSMGPKENQVYARFDAPNVPKHSNGQSGAVGPGKFRHFNRFQLTIDIYLI